MRTLPKILIPLTLVLGLFCCSPQEDLIKDQKGTMRLGFSESINPNGRISDLPDNLFAIVSIENEMGGPVLTSEKIELFKFNNEYLSKPISLVAGLYHLTEYLIVDSQNNVLLATPKLGSQMANLVEQPLPILFAVSKDEITKLIPEVLFVNDQTPKDFGYVSFGFNIVETFDFLISVFIQKDNSYELTPVTLLIVNNLDTVVNTSLFAETNQITIPSRTSHYLLIIKKEGYLPYFKSYSEEALKTFFENPLEIVLKEAECVKFYTDQSVLEEVTLNMEFPKNKEIKIHWDDGTVDVLYSGIKHLYTNPGKYRITVYGDLDAVDELDVVRGRITNMDIAGFVNLRQLILVGSHIKHLNLSANTALKRFYSEENSMIKQIDISGNYNLELLVIDFNTDLNQLLFSEFSMLKNVRIFKTGLHNLTLKNNFNLEHFEVVVNPNLQNVNLENLELSKGIYLDQNPQLTQVRLKQIGEVDDLVIANGNVENINLDDVKDITSLYVFNNALKSVNVRQFKELSTIDAKSNSFDAAAVNQILSDVLYSVENLNMRAGRLNVTSNAAPTGQGLIDKDKLINDYGWTVLTD